MKAHFSHVIQLILIYILSVLCGLLLVAFECSNYGYIQYTRRLMPSTTEAIFKNTPPFQFNNPLQFSHSQSIFHSNLLLDFDTNNMWAHNIRCPVIMCAKGIWGEEKRRESTERNNNIVMKLETKMHNISYMYIATIIIIKKICQNSKSFVKHSKKFVCYVYSFFLFSLNSV